MSHIPGIYDAPAKTTGNGVAAGTLRVPYNIQRVPQPEYEEGIDIDQTKVNGGAPGRVRLPTAA